MKFLRIVFFYIFFFILCLPVIVVVLESWSSGAQVLFILGTPALLVWWKENRRTETLPAIDHRAKSIELAGQRSTIDATPPRDQKPGTPAIDHRAKSIELAVQHLTIDATPPRAKKLKQGWVPRGETVIVAGRQIDGMVYVGTAPLLNTYDDDNKCRAYIDPSLSVASSGTDFGGDGMPYWPSYSDILPVCRATYLDWLAGGKSDASYNPGYLFLYFYGLERRFILDQPSDEEKREILEEVQRLKGVYPENRSVQRYLGDFAEKARILLNEMSSEPVFDNHGWDVPLSVKVMIGTKITDGGTLSSEWLLSWFLCHPERQLRTSATRCPDEFRELFRLRFEERFPQGLKITKPRKILKADYQAASSEFQVDFSLKVNGKPVPDISYLRRPIEISQEIADKIMDDLDKFSRFLRRNPDGRGSLEAQALLPSELWSSFPSKELEALKDWARSLVENGGFVIVADAIARLEGERPQKIRKQQLTGVADVLARIGFGMAPDPRFALRSPKPEEPVVIFELGEAVEQLEDVSKTYRAALIELTLGAFIAHADGRIVEEEKRWLQDRILKAGGITDLERKRLYANLEWLLAVPPDMALLRRKLKDIGTEQQAEFRAVVVAVAHADNIIQPQEVARIENIYKVLGLDTTMAYADLHMGSVTDDPIHVKSAEKSAPGEAIPAKAPAMLTELDSARIAGIRSETERVSEVLGKIFAVDEDAEAITITSLSPILTGLNVKHVDLVRELVEQDHWSENAFEKLIDKHRLMLSGALEVVNEWAFKHYDEALLDEYNGYEVSQGISEALRVEFAKEVS